MAYKRLEVRLVWKHNEAWHLFSKELTQLLEDFNTLGLYNAETCMEFWDKERIDEFGKWEEWSSIKFKFILFMLGCTKETWINDFHGIYSTREHGWVVVRTNRVLPLHYHTS